MSVDRLAWTRAFLTITGKFHIIVICANSAVIDVWVDVNCVGQLQIAGVDHLYYETTVMRTAEDFRNRQIARLPFALQRPAMFCASDVAAEQYFYDLLADLCWIDERDADWERLKAKFVWGCQGVFGQLLDQPARMPNYLGEIASSYAQIAHILGYFNPARLLTQREWERLSAALENDFFSRNWRESEVRERFGSPSHEVYGCFTTVACYAPADPSNGWIFFDLARKFPASEDYLPEPFLRDVRIHRNQFRLLKDGDWCRGCQTDLVSPHQFRRDNVIQMSVVSIEGDHLGAVGEVLHQVGFTIEKSFTVNSGDHACVELLWHPVACRIAKVAYRADGWTHIVDPQMVLAAADIWLDVSKEWKATIIGWGYSPGYAGITVIRDGERVRDVLYSHGTVVVNHGTPLVEESGIEWNDPNDDAILDIAERLGARYDDLADREYLVFRLDESPRQFRMPFQRVMRQSVQ